MVISGTLWGCNNSTYVGAKTMGHQKAVSLGPSNEWDDERPTKGRNNMLF